MKTLLSVAAALLLIAGIGFVAMRALERAGKMVHEYEHRIQSVESGF